MAVVNKGDLADDRLELYRKSAYSDGYLAVDCEMMGLNPHRDRLCLVQMCDGEGNVTLVQVFPGQDAAPNLKALLEDKQITKIFHFARADLKVLKKSLCISVEPVFCTKIASKLARTYSDKHGLKELAREFLGLDLDKTSQSSDWGREELSSEQIEYASEDVVHLRGIMDRLVEILERENRLELAKRSFTQIPLLVDLDLLGYQYLFEHHGPLTRN